MRFRLLIALAVISCNDNTAKEDTTLADPPKDPASSLLVVEANAAAPRRAEPHSAEPRAAEPDAAEQMGYGSANISVNTIGDVNCKVTLGNRDLGGAPVFKQRVPPGDYLIAIDCPSGRGYGARIVLKDGDDERVIVRPDMWQRGPPLPGRRP